VLFLEASEKYQLSGSRREGVMWLGKSPRQNLTIAWDPNGFAKDPRSFCHSLVPACPELPDGRRGTATGKNKMLPVASKVLVSHRCGETPIPHR